MYLDIFSLMVYFRQLADFLWESLTVNGLIWSDVSNQYLHFRFIVNHQHMILDAALLLLVTFGLQLIKSRFPNFLFFAKGAVLFLPPEDLPEIKPKKKKQKTQAEVSVIKIQYQNVKDYPFSTELSRIILTTTTVSIFVFIRLIVGWLFNYQSLITFYVIVILLIYSLKLGIETFLLTNYSRKNCILISLGLNIFFYVLFVSLQTFEGVYDQTINQVVHDYIKHLQIVFNRELNFITPRLLIGLALFINFFVTLALTPAVIKFGNWYAKTLKEMYYDDQEGESIAMARRADREERDTKQQQSKLKQESRQTIYKLNFYLGAILVTLVLSHRYALNFLDQLKIDLIRGVCMVIGCYAICDTLNRAIQFNGSFAYRYVLEFFDEQDSQKRGQLKKKIVPYIYYIWYHYFQFISRIILPMLLFLLVITWKYFFFEANIATQPIEIRPLNTDYECPINLDHIDILKNLYRCQANANSTIDQTHFFLNGLITSIPADLSHERIQRNMQKYSVLTRSIMVQFSEQLFWYSTATIYLMTVSYILFLRKTVYDL